MGRYTGAALLCAVASAGFLHLAPSRSAAGWVVLLVLPWGLAASQAHTTRGIRHLMLAAVFVRIVQLGAVPTLSDDLYRYLFEGLALNQGANPFLHAPAALADLDPVLAAKVNHPNIPSIYPPMAQLWFRCLALIGTGAVVAQATMAGVDVLNVWLIRRLTPQTPWAAWVYALHPVAVLESAHGAHLEPLAMAFCLGTVWAIEEEHPIAGVLALFGVGTKLLPVFFMPALLRRLGWRRFLMSTGLGLGILVVIASPVLHAGPALLSALGTYSSSWSFNGLAHPLLKALLGPGARPVLAIAGIGLAVWASRLPARSAWYVIGSGFVLLSPTVHPWYTLWALVPALLLGRRDWAVAATALQGSYFVLTTLEPNGMWHPPWWLGLATWGPALVALVYYARKVPIPTAP